MALIEPKKELIEGLALNSTLSGSISSLCRFWGMEGPSPLILSSPFWLAGFLAAILGLCTLGKGVGVAKSSDKASLLIRGFSYVYVGVGVASNSDRLLLFSWLRPLGPAVSVLGVEGSIVMVDSNYRLLREGRAFPT